MHPVRSLVLALSASLAGTAIHASSIDEQLGAIEARIAQLEAAQQTGDAGTPNRGNLRINGFLSAGAGTADVPSLVYDNGLVDGWTHKADAIVGLRVDGRVNPEVSAVTQLVARGSHDFAPGIDWAYVAWEPTGSDLLRLGRQRYPLFGLSEYLGVGAAYPWAKPPAEVYLEFMPPNYDGLAWQHRFSTGDWAHTTQVYAGSSSFDVSGGTFTLKDAAGMSWLATVNDWQFNATYSQATSSFHNPFVDGLSSLGFMRPVDKVYGWFAGLGFQYDDGNWFLTGEATEIHVHGYFPDTAQQYLTLGYRIGKVMPHVTWAARQVLDAEERPALAALPAMCPPADPNPLTSMCLAIMPNMSSAPPPTTIGIPFPADSLSRAMHTTQDSVTLGVRYDVLPNTDVKLDWTRIIDTHGSFGLFSPPDGNVFYAALPGDDIDVFRIVVDVTF